MKTRFLRSALAFFLGVSAPVSMLGQWITGTNGEQHLTSPSDGVNVGFTAGTTPSVLTINGGDFPALLPQVFRSIVPAGNNSFWKMQRDVNEIGWLYTTNPNFGFHLRASMDNGGGVSPPGILWLENFQNDGLMLRANDATGAFTLPVNGFPLGTDAFISVGRRAGGTNLMPSRARFQLVDDNGTVEQPWRPYFRKGVLFTGNNDMGYIGHVYHDASNGTTPWTYTLDRSDLVISAGENDLTDPLRQRIRFTYTTRPQ